ncbi:MAG: response regulator [Alphaproteobacteria bacterium]|nr:response regulator [Alphaproteobacteria bacterium]
MQTRDTDSSPRPGPHGPADTGASQEGRVLVVDDDPRQRYEVASCLARAGLQVFECEDGAAVLDGIEEVHPHLVILDINSPHRDGDLIARDIIDRHPDVKILLMTGDPERARSANEAHLKVFTVMEKPVPLRALVRFVTSSVAASKEIRRGAARAFRYR